MTSLTVEIERPDPTTVVVTAAGEIESTNASLLRERLIEVFTSQDVASHLVVDLSQVSYMDSVGLGVLVGAYHRAVGVNATMTVVASGPVRRVMELTGLGKLWTLADPPSA